MCFSLMIPTYQIVHDIYVKISNNLCKFHDFRVHHTFNTNLQKLPLENVPSLCALFVVLKEKKAIHYSM